MKRISTEFSGVGPGMPMPAEIGEQVNATVPAGCLLRKSADLVQWVDIATATPFVHEGDDASYRIDCVVYYGVPVTATLEIA